MLIAHDANNAGVRVTARPALSINISSQIRVDLGVFQSVAAFSVLINLACPQSPGFLPAFLPLSKLSSPLFFSVFM